MNNQINAKKTIYILLTLIIIAGICRFSYGFFVQKQSFHSDEAWSFGLANSYYEPYVQYNDDVTKTKNTNAWLSSKVFRNYLTVQDGERFSFGSTYYNLSCDTHPPLYFFILHFLSSFFPDQYVFSLGFIINIIAYIFLAIYLYKLLMLVTKSSNASLLGVLFSSFSLAMLCMTMFVRMYMLVATIALIYTYLNVKLFYNASYRKKTTSYVIIGIISCIGALTDNFFLPYAFTLTFVMCIGWLINKEYKVLLKYASCMIIGIGLSILIFPNTVMGDLGMLGVTSSNNIEDTVQPISKGQKRFMPLWFQFKLALIYINREFLGFDIISPFKTMFLPYLLCCILIIFILLCAVYFLFRKDSWFINFRQKLKSRLNNIFHNFFRHFNFVILAMFLAIITVCFVVADKTDLYQLGNYGDRYLMVCYPAVMVIMFLLVNKIVNLILPTRHKLAIVILCFILVIPTIFSNIRTCHYFMATDGTTQLESISKNSDFIIVSSRKWLLVQYAAKLLDCDEFFFTQYDDLADNIDKISNHTKNKKTYLVVDITFLNDELNSLSGDTSYDINDALMNTLDQKSSSDYTVSDILDTCKDISFISSLNYIGHDYINGYRLNIYEVN